MDSISEFYESCPSPGYLYDGPKSLTVLLIQLINGSNLSLENDIRIIKNVTLLTNSLLKDKNPKRYEILIQNDYHEMLVYVVKYSRQSSNLRLLFPVLSLLVTVTNNSEDFILALMKTDLPDLLINDTIHFSEIRNADIDSFWTQQYLMITFNIICHGKYRGKFQNNKRIAQYKESLTRLLSSENIDIKITSLCLLAFLYQHGNDPYKDIIMAHSDIIKDIHRYITMAMISEYRTVEMFDIWELLVGLQALSAIDVIRTKMVDIDGLIPTLIRIASTDQYTTQEVVVTIQILRNLCYDDNIQRRLTKEFNINDIIEKLAHHAAESIKKIANVFLIELHSIVEQDRDYDVFVSYSTADSEIMLKIVERLKRKLKVYIDIRKHKKIDFTDKIERSKVIIIGASSSYYNSDRCFEESNHACKLSKRMIPLILIHKFRPSDWLAQIIQSMPSCDFSDMSQFNNSIDMLFKLIHGNMKPNNEPMTKLDLKRTDCQRNSANLLSVGESFGEEYDTKAEKSIEVSERDNEAQRRKVSDLIKSFEAASMKDFDIDGYRQKENVLVNPVKSVTPDNVKPPCDNYKEWSKSRVSQWLTDNNLSDIHNKLNHFDGDTLVSIQNMKQHAPATYYEQMSNSLKLTFIEILRFDSALYKLSN